MKSDACGLIFADDRRIHLSDLTRLRALAAVPFAGRYRLVDFALSNLVNSGVSKVGIVTRNKFKSLVDHVGTGSNWDLDHKNQGVYLLAPYITSESYRGQSDDLLSIQNFLKHDSNEYVIICGSNVVFNSNLRDVLRCHEETGADMTVMYDRHDTFPSKPNIVLETDGDDRLLNVWVDPAEFVSNKLCLGTMIIKRELMIKIVSEAISKGVSEFNTEYMLRLCSSLDVRCYEFKGKCLRINSVQDYFAATMELLDPKVNRQIFWTEDPLYTKVKDEAPTFYSETSDTENSIVSDGCVIEGNVYNSMIFRGVQIAGGSQLKKCIVFQNVSIGEGCHLENVIIDKDCVIRPGIRLIGQSGYPIVIGKGATV